MSAEPTLAKWREEHPDERGVFVELWILDLVDGDYPTAILLSQLLWWHQPGRDGLPKLRYERDGHRWLLKPDEWWDVDCRLTVKQVRRVRKILVDAGLVVCRRFKLNDAPTTAWRPSYEAIREARDAKCPISELPSQGQFHGSDPAGAVGSDPAGAVPSSSSTKGTTTERTRSSESDPSPPPLPPSEALTLCQTLASLMEGNGCKRPTVSKAWVTEADRLLRIDQRPFDEAMRVLRWSQADSFWRQNVLSVDKLRKHYDRLRLRMAEGANGGGNRSYVPNRDNAFEAGRDQPSGRIRA